MRHFVLQTITRFKLRGSSQSEIRNIKNCIFVYNTSSIKPGWKSVKIEDFINCFFFGFLL